MLHLRASVCGLKLIFTALAAGLSRNQVLDPLTLLVTPSFEENLSGF